MINNGKVMKLYLLWILSCAALFIAGYLIGMFKYYSKDSYGGDVFFLRGRYKASFWYHDKGELCSVEVRDIDREQKLVENNMSPEGYTKSFFMKLPDKNLFVVLDRTGNPVLRDYMNEKGNIYRQEYLDPNGQVFKIKEYPNPDPLAFIRNMDINEVRNNLKILGSKKWDKLEPNEAKVEFLKIGGFGWYTEVLGVDANNIEDPNYFKKYKKIPQ